MKKFVLVALALCLTAAFSPAKAGCINLWVVNGSGSPPVVNGSTVNVAVLWEAPYADVFLDGNLVASYWDPVNPPGTQWLDTFQVPVANGSHTLHSVPGTCLVNFTVAPPLSAITDTASMTAGLSGTWGSPGTAYKGFRSGLGSMTPATTSTGKTYSQLLDRNLCVSLLGATICLKHSWLEISGFTSDPGQGWLVSVSAQGVTRAGSAASYTYDNATGSARWSWGGQWFGFVPSSTTTVTTVHY